MKYFPLILFALLIDGLQMLLMLGFTALQFATPVGGGVSGALAAGSYCWTASSGILSGIVNFAQCTFLGGVVGAGVSAFAIPLGIGVDIALTLTFGSGLILVLAWLGMFYPGTVMGSFLGETIPLFNVLPGWTLMTWRCIYLKAADEKKKKATSVTASQSWVAMEEPLQFKAPTGMHDIKSRNESYANAA